MKLLSFSNFIIFATLPILLWLLIKKLKTTKISNTNRLPPGPWKLPIIGSMHHLVGDLPHRKLRNLAIKYGPLFHLKLGELDYIIITSAEHAREIMITHDISSASRPEFLATKIILYDSTDIAFLSYGKYWSQLRKICTTELLSTKRVESMSFIREEEGEFLIEKIRRAKDSPLNLSEMLMSLANINVFRAAFGRECPHEKKFLNSMKLVFKYLSGFNIVDLYPSMSFLGVLTGYKAKLERVHQLLDEILDEILEKHLIKSINGDDNNEEDIIDVLFKLKNSGNIDIPLTTDNIKAVILDLFLAGTDTVFLTMEWAMSELIRHPNVMEKVQLEVRKAFEGKEKIDERQIAQIPFLKHVIKETLRLHPAAPLLIPRLCRETINIDGYIIPTGSTIVINAWAIMRDSRHWSDPEIFRPERFDEATFDYKGSKYEYIPFGGGRRICPGIIFAISGIEYWLALLLFNFDWKLSEGIKPEELDMKEDFGIITSRKNDLLVLATQH